MKTLRLSLLVALLCALTFSTALAAPTITATQDDATAAATRKLVGDTVTYTTTISNTAAVIVGSTVNDATGVTLTNPTPANTTDSGTVTISPVAFDDVYPQTVLPNIGINSGNIPYSAFSNDFLGTPAVTTVASFTQPAHGTVTMVTSGVNIGQFTYEPAAGYTGADSFTYTLTNAVGSSFGTVNLTVAASPVIWFVNPAVGVTGTGTLSSPFKTVAEAVTAIGANTSQRIFLYSGAQTTGITLRANGWLVGQASFGTNFDSVMGISPGSGTIARPVLNSTRPALSNASGSVVTLADNNTILGVAISGGATGAAVASSGTVNSGLIGNAAASDVTISGAGGGAFSLGAGNGTFNINAPITSVTGRSVAVTGRSAGTVAFTRAISDTGTGISLTSNTGATINFTAGLNLSTGANAAFTATGGGAVSATQNNTSIVNTLTTTTGTALNVSNTAIGASGLTFRSISANGAANGIVLSNTGASGGLTVTGNSNGQCGGQVTGFPATVTGPNAADCTGGVIQSSTGAGMLLTNTRNISLTRMRIANGQDDGVFGTTVTNFTVSACLIENNGNAVEEANLDFDNLHGASSITNSVVRLAHENNVEVRNNANNGAQATLSVTGCTINNASAKTQSTDGVLYEGQGTANMSITVSGCALFANRGDHLQAATNNDGDMVAVFSNNTLTGGHSLGQGQDIVLNTGLLSPGATFTYDVNGNSINGAILSAITVTLGAPSTGATMSGRIRNNIIGTTGVAESGSRDSNGITINHQASGTLTAAITGNTIRQWEQRGISASAFNNATAPSGQLNLTIQSNTILEGNALDPVSGVGGREAIIIIAGSSAAGDLNTLCLQLGGAGALANNVNRGPEAVVSGEQDIRLRARSASTFRLPGYGGSAADTAAVQTFVAGMNTSSADGVVGVVADKAATSNGFVGGAACAVPPLLLGPGGIEARQATSFSPVVQVNRAGRQHSSSAIAAPASEISTSQPRDRFELSQSALDRVVAAAVSRWNATGLSDEQRATLDSLQFEAADLPGMRLGEADGDRIRVDNNAGGNGWFVASDAAAFVEAGDNTRHYTTPSTPAAGRIDLLTTIMHEMGHALGLSDSYLEQDRDNVMYGFLTKGERRLPAKGQAIGAQPGAQTGPHFLGGPINLGTLPPGKTVKVQYSVVVGPITGNPQNISSQAVISGGGFSNVNAVDAVAGSGATVTLLAIPPAFTSTNATTFTVGTAGSFSVTANGAPGPTFSVTTGTLPGGVTLSAAGLLSGNPNPGTGGTYPVTITANNGVAPNAAQNFTLTVNQAPAITSANATTFVVGSAGTFTVTKTGFPAPTLSQSGTLPTGVSFDTGTGVLSGTPAAGTGGSYPLTFTAANGVGSNAVQSFTLTVNQAPAITSANTTTFTAGTAGNFNVTATGFPAPAINLTSGTLPAGVNFGTGTLAGTSTAFGTFPLTFTASNGVGSNAVQNFSLIVNPSASAVKSGGKIQKDAGGGYRIDFLGNPGQQYTVQYVGFLPAQPADWQTLELKVADPNGIFFSIDNPPAGTTLRFYRAIIP